MNEVNDYHMHSILSDGKNCYEEMIKTAIKRGFKEIGFSDHLCLKQPLWAISEVDIPVMTEQIEQLKTKYQSEITIRFGAEIDYFPEFEAEIYQQIKSLPLDYVIGSVHFIEDWNFDSNHSFYGKWTNDQLYEMYFERVQLAAQSSLFDIVGHLDLIKKFQIYPESNLAELFEDTLKIIHENDLVVEVNTSGIDHPCNELFPAPPIIEQCYQHHIPVILSSDAHNKEQIGRHFKSGITLLKQIGFDRLAKFEKRNRSFYPI